MAHLLEQLSGINDTAHEANAAQRSLPGRGGKHMSHKEQQGHLYRGQHTHPVDITEELVSNPHSLWRAGGILHALSRLAVVAQPVLIRYIRLHGRPKVTMHQFIVCVREGEGRGERARCGTGRYLSHVYALEVKGAPAASIAAQQVAIGAESVCERVQRATLMAPSTHLPSSATDCTQVHVGVLLLPSWLLLLLLWCVAQGLMDDTM